MSGGYRGGSIPELKAAIERVIAEIGNLQSGLSTVKDRSDAVTQMMATIAAGGTSAPEPGVVAAMGIDVSESTDNALAATVAAVQSLEEWMARL